MAALFALAPAAAPAATASILPPYLVQGVLGMVIYSVLAMCLFFVFWKVIDLITPGILDKELVPGDGKQPNVALAIVVAALIIGFCYILASAMH